MIRSASARALAGIGSGGDSQLLVTDAHVKQFLSMEQHLFLRYLREGDASIQGDNVAAIAAYYEAFARDARVCGARIDVCDSCCLLFSAAEQRALEEEQPSLVSDRSSRKPHGTVPAFASASASASASAYSGTASTPRYAHHTLSSSPTVCVDATTAQARRRTAHLFGFTHPSGLAVVVCCCRCC